MLFTLRCLIAIVLCLSVATGTIAADRAPADEELGLPHYVVIAGAEGAQTREEAGASYTLADSLYYEWAGSVFFRVNHTGLDPRSPLLTELVDSVLPWARARRMRLAAVDLRGAASPEGPRANNVSLAHGRARALLDSLAPHLAACAGNPGNETSNAVSPRIVATDMPEDYLGLLWMMRRASDPAATFVAGIIARHGAGNSAAIKAHLQSADGGRLWSRLLRDYFPALRAARIVLWFEPTAIGVGRLTPPVESAMLDAGPLAAVSEAAIVSHPVAMERRHLLSVGTNLLYDAFYMPGFGWAPMLNVQLEYYPRHGHFTFLAAFTSPYYHRWSRHKFFQIRDYRLEARRYFNPGDRHTGPYLGAYVNANVYGIGLGPRKGWEGEGIGGALKIGYVIPLGSGRWRLDLHMAAGAYRTRFDRYRWGNPVTGEIDGDYYYDYTGPIDLFGKRRFRRWWMGPTEVGVTLTFDLLYRRAAGGVSWRGKEVRTP